MHARTEGIETLHLATSGMYSEDVPARMHARTEGIETCLVDL